MKIFNPEQQEIADIILENNHLMPLKNLYSSEIKELAIAWSYYSGKIEGNTYTFVETETLLKDGITSPRRYEDAKELKNLYNTFIAEAEYIKKGENLEVIDEKLVFRLHTTLMQDLVSDEEKGVLRTRSVGITGTTFKPISMTVLKFNRNSPRYYTNKNKLKIHLKELFISIVIWRNYNLLLMEIKEPHDYYKVSY